MLYNKPFHMECGVANKKQITTKMKAPFAQAINECAIV